MTPSEYAAWVDYYELCPFDDMHRYHRPAALIAQSMRGGEMRPLLEILVPGERPSSDYSDADLKTMEAFGIKPPVG